jgi:hypothetical protein
MDCRSCYLQIRPGNQYPRLVDYEMEADKRRDRLMLLLAGLGLCCSSCAKGPSSLYPVRGRVFQAGQPTPGALVILHPLGESRATGAKPRGRVGADGAFTLTTFTTNDGAAPGTYAVTIHWRWRDEEDGEEEGDRLPAYLASPETSGLRVEVRAGVNDLPPFLLE